MRWSLISIFDDFEYLWFSREVVNNNFLIISGNIRGILLKINLYLTLTKFAIPFGLSPIND